MRLIIVATTLFIAAIAMTPEEEACAAPLMKKLSKEQDADLKKFIMKCFKLMNAGKRDEVITLGKKYAVDHKDKIDHFMNTYLVDECAMFRKEFDELM